MSLTKLRQERAELVKKAEKAHNASIDPKNADMAEDLVNEFDDTMAAIAVIDSKIERAAKVEALLSDGKAPAGTRQIGLDEPEEKEKPSIPANVRRPPVVNFLPREVSGMDAEKRAYAFGCHLFASAALTNPGKYHHLAGYVQKAQDLLGPMNAAKEGGNAGIWVPDQFGTDIVSNALKYGVARNLANVVQMTSDKRTDPKEGSDPTPAFVGEGGSGTDVTPTDDSTVTLTAKKLMAILMYSSELNEDAIISFADNMLRRAGRGFAKKEDQCMFIGDGTSTYGGMVGVNTRLQDIDGAGTDSFGLVTGTGSASWTALTLANFEQVIATLPDLDSSAEDAAAWVCNRTFYYQVMAKLMLASGGVTAEEVANGRRQPIFMGWPVVFSNVFPSAAAASSVVATFGDYSRAVNFGDRRMYTVDFSSEATIGSVNLFQTDQLAVRITERFDIAAHSLGTASVAGPVVGIETGA